MKKIKEESVQIKIIFAGMILALAAVVLPLFIISHYNFRSADDYQFSEAGEDVWEQTHSVGKVLALHMSGTKAMYDSWQGTYSDILLTLTLMGFFAKDSYYLGTYLSLGGLVLSEFLFLMVILMRVLKADFFRSGIVAIGCLCIQILLIPVPVEAFFWFCGAVRYVFIHALALLLLTVLILLCQTRRRHKVVLLEGLALLLSLTVAGANYVTAITVLILYCLAVFWGFVKRHSYKWLYMGNAVFYLTAFLVSCLAPGNRNRQAVSGIEPMSPVMAILQSLWEAIKYINVNTIFPCMILGMLFFPLFLNIVRKRQFRYPWPILVTLLSFGVFAAQFTPNLYALHEIGEGRLLNIYRLNFYLLLYGNELYWTGWAARKWFCEKDGQAAQIQTEKISYLLPGWGVGGVLLCLALFFWGGTTLSSVSAVQSLRDGTAATYWQEEQERLAILEDNTESIAYLKPFTYKPYLLFFVDVEQDSSNWVNEVLASYYGKEEVRLLGSEE